MSGDLPILKNILAKRSRFNDLAPGCMIHHDQTAGTRQACRAADYRAHIEGLAEEHDIKIVWQENTRARAWRKPRRVRLSPIKTGATYAYALHESGHIAGRQGPSDRCGPSSRARTTKSTGGLRLKMSCQYRSSMY